MEDNRASTFRNYPTTPDLVLAEFGQLQGGSNSKCHDDDGRPKRTGTVWTASARIITAVLGSAVLSLPWAICQLGWVAGLATMLVFSFVTYYTSALLSDCYRSGDPCIGCHNYTYMDAVKANLSDIKVKICGFLQYANLVCVAIGCIITASLSMAAIKRSNCFHQHWKQDTCRASSNINNIIFGIVQIIFSQIPDFDQNLWVSIVATIMFFSYAIICLGLGIVQVVANGRIKGSFTGIRIGIVTPVDKVWQSLQAVGDIAFAYSYSVILIEIQDTIKSPPPSEAKVMKRSTIISLVGTTVLYIFFGSVGYAAFGDATPGNLLTGFGFYNPFWLLDIANASNVICDAAAYQVACRRIFPLVEKWAEQTFPEFIKKETTIHMSSTRSCNLNYFRLIWHSIFVMLTTVISMLMPFFNDVVRFLGALSFWPLTVYFSVEMYIVQKKVPKWSTRWKFLQLMSLACLIISVAAAGGSIAGIVSDLKVYKPFKTNYSFVKETEYRK